MMLFAADKEQWGGWLSCLRCGHPSGYHGVTFCQVMAGSDDKRRCDCKGWFAWDPDRRTSVIPEPDTEATGASE